MIHMDVDIHSPGPHSPSFRSMRQYSGKRTRSPEPSSPIDRPSKRLTVATGLSGRANTGYRIASSSRETSEDWVWVQQTGDLAIASPACGAFAGRGNDEGRLESVADIDMAVDHDAIMDENYDAPSLEGLSTYSKLIHPLATLHPPDQASDKHSALSSMIMASAHSADALPEPVSTSPPPPSLAPMSISPESSFAQLPQSQRKLRFTMGPRSDCEKCRLGVKGHWMHLD